MVRPVPDRELKRQGGRVVAEEAGTVRRPAGHWSASVQSVLEHLHETGFAACPRPLGQDQRGSDIESLVGGQPIRKPWPAALLSETSLAQFADLVRRFHEAVRSYMLPAKTSWRRRPDGGIAPGEIVCHGDLRPANFMHVNGRPTAIVDWEFASPAPPAFDVGFLALHLVPLRDDTWARAAGFGSIPDRARRLSLIADTYGLSATQITEGVDAFLAEEIRLVRELGQDGLEPWKQLLDSDHDQTLLRLRDDARALLP